MSRCPSPDGRRWVAARRNFLLPVKPLGAHMRTLFQEQLRQRHPELFRQVPAKVWRRHWNVDSRPAGSGENALRYLARYVFKTATRNRPVPALPDGRLRWSYRESKTGKNTTIALAPREFMRRFLQHILPRHFARVRTFGWLHPAAKVRANRVRALLRQTPVLTSKEQETWPPPPEPERETASPPQLATNNSPPVRCPHCQQVMRLIGSWHPGRPLLFPNRPPCDRPSRPS